MTPSPYLDKYGEYFYVDFFSSAMSAHRIVVIRLSKILKNQQVAPQKLIFFLGGRNRVFGQYIDNYNGEKKKSDT